MKKKILLALAAVISVLIFSCSNKKYYNKYDVRILNIEARDNALIIYYKVPLETFYYSSGVDYYFKKSDSLELKFIKEELNTESIKKVSSNLVSTKIEQKLYGVDAYIIKIPNKFTGKNINENKKRIIVVDN